MEIDSNDYHDFVFKNGRLIGEFEQMYSKSAEVPWHQDRSARSLDCRIALALAATAGPFDTIRDIGCGLGYFLDALSALGARGCRLEAYDVSPTATAKARSLFPYATFDVLDVTSPPESMRERSAASATGADRRLTTIRACFWYLLPHMDRVVRNLRAITGDGQHLLVSQNFPPLDAPFVGKEVIPTPDRLLEHLAPCFQPLLTNGHEDRTSRGNDNILTALLIAR